MESGFEGTSDDLERAGKTRSAGDNQRYLLNADAALLGDEFKYLGCGKLTCFQNADDTLGFFAKADFFKERLARASRAHGTAAHRGEFADRDLPAGVLRSLTGKKWLVGLNCYQCRCVFTAEKGNESYLAETGKTDLGQ